MITKRQQMVNEAVDELDCTDQERSDVREHLRDLDADNIRSKSHARDYALIMLTVIRDANAEDKAAPQWEQVNYANCMCKASCCLDEARWEIETMIDGVMFNVQACDYHAGKEADREVEED